MGLNAFVVFVLVEGRDAGARPLEPVVPSAGVAVGGRAVVEEAGPPFLALVGAGRWAPDGGIPNAATAASFTRQSQPS